MGFCQMEGDMEVLDEEYYETLEKTIQGVELLKIQMECDETLLVREGDLT